MTVQFDRALSAGTERSDPSSNVQDHRRQPWRRLP